MSDPTGPQRRPGPAGLPCPECGALRAPDNTPSCACAQRASDALRDTRTAEAAAAEDFDPLRIRPYVELGDAKESGGAAEPSRGGGSPQGGGTAWGGESTRDGGSAQGGGTAWGGESGAADMTMPLRTVPAADATMPLRRIPPDAGSGAEPSTPDLNLFEPPDGHAPGTGTDTHGKAHGDVDDDERPRSRRRRTLLIAASAAAVAVVAAAGFASGLFSYETPTRDGAAPEDVRAAVPDASTSEASPSPTASRSASPSASDASPSPSESTNPSPSEESTASASPSASVSPDETPAEPTARTTGSLAPENGADDSQDTAATVVLRRGDKGAEVTELQLRLRQLYLYNGDTDGAFSSAVEDALRNYQWSRGITADDLGVYGAATRTSLESETKEP
ncbi:peptidoglycan-binding protein [Streptomyces sp. NBC_01275]|uniref:peptidoglycan-binding protein n=1 Tax=Streptomyces sp. NBC_01275 TaxID=2903807 RepID=UPI002256535F|nr:peptidoglycan-binding protein [Streptomyces sp. NBC_01275]MCX4761629.1 peptidoglycan-binding protein [Streptomyces sp. NBC_01275]